MSKFAVLYITSPRTKPKIFLELKCFSNSHIGKSTHDIPGHIVDKLGTRD